MRSIFKFFTQAIEALGDSIPIAGEDEDFDTYNKLKAKQLTGQAPDFELPDVKGQKIRLADFRGKHLCFWIFGHLGALLVEKRTRN